MYLWSNLEEYGTNGSNQHFDYNANSTEFNTGPPPQTNPHQNQMTRQKHSISDPRQMNRRNPLEVNVNKKKQFEAVDPFASNNPYSKVI